MRSIWSPDDELVNGGAPGGRGLVYWKPTSQIPGQDGETVLPHVGHMALKDTAQLQFELISGDSEKR